MCKPNWYLGKAPRHLHGSSRLPLAACVVLNRVLVPGHQWGQEGEGLMGSEDAGICVKLYIKSTVASVTVITV